MNDPNAQRVEKLEKLVRNMKVAMLTTVEADGSLRSRPMAAVPTDFDGTLWFFSDRDTAKCHEVEAQRHVNVSYENADKNQYLSVSGKAEVVTDRARIEQLWNPLFKAWFPEGLADPDLVLLRVDASSAEFWETPSSRALVLLGIAKALIRGERYQPGLRQRVELQPH